MPWTPEDTEQWLTENPLPRDFHWPPEGTAMAAAAGGSKLVLPTYRLHKGYGFWLKTTPYHRGLFARCHQLLEERNGLFNDADELAEELVRRPDPAKDGLLPGIEI